MTEDFEIERYILGQFIKIENNFVSVELKFKIILLELVNLYYDFEESQNYSIDERLFYSNKDFNKIAESAKPVLHELKVILFRKGFDIEKGEFL